MERFYRDVTKQNVELAHKHGLATCVWTVNREKDIIRMIEYGVDGIITDYPKKFKKFVNPKIFLGFKVKNLKIFYLNVNNRMPKKNIKETG